MIQVVHGPGTRNLPLDRLVHAVWMGIDDDLRSGILQFSHESTLVGIEGRALRRQHAAGSALALRRGVYVSTDAWEQLSRRDRYLLKIHAVLETHPTRAVLSHESAAAFWELPHVGPEPKNVHLIARDGRRHSSQRGVVWHTVMLGDDDVVDSEGILVTSLLRTMLDIARARTFMDAVVGLDAGLAHIAREAAALEAATEAAEAIAIRLSGMVPGRGSKRALAAIEFASPLAQSPGESASRVQMHVCGFPPPVLQYPVTDRAGTIWHADFGWPAYKLLGEFDGYVKYSRNEYLGTRRIEDVVWAEKKREDLMRGTGRGMVRWLWKDAMSPRLLTSALVEAGLPRR